MAHDLVTELLQYSSLACFMPIWQLCANLLIPNCLRSNLSYSPLAALELYVKIIILRSSSANSGYKVCLFQIVSQSMSFFDGKRLKNLAIVYGVICALLPPLGYQEALPIKESNVSNKITEHTHFLKKLHLCCPYVRHKCFR